MALPFPGMDPYLEGSHWSSFHSAFTGEIARQLAPKLSAKYLVLPAERFVLDMLESVSVTAASMYPDIGVFKGHKPDGNGTVATAPLRLATVIPEAVPHVTIEIRDRANRQLVSAIELLSPTNKRGEGRVEYLEKRRRILQSSAHLMEIDLLRQGQRVPMREPLPLAPYFVFLSRVEHRPITDIWPLALDQPLPVVPIPLLPGDADVPLDLQVALVTIYDLFHYDRVVDHSQPPEVPLSPDETAWAQELVRRHANKNSA